MAVPIRFTKDPNAVLDYVLNWSKWLASGDTISSVTATPDTGITVDDTDFDATTTTLWLSGGTAGSKYNIRVHVVTANGRQDDRTVQITVAER